MALDYDKLMSKVENDLPFNYTDADAMLYALSIGMGTNPLDESELDYVYEQGVPLKTVPTLATVLVPEMFPVGLGWDYSQILHSEQRLHLFRPLPPAADLLINKRVVDAFDRGPQRGALILLEAEGRLASDDT
ncbi:MAG: 3-alpha,7-alpha,12-alpha-trihydroxy-5-beta-cholest-24-enoyl-CoA hydratase, partial [Gammaproteobacteria bacterium]|nr:3-alpha,7-alpha,12-alpha-trihydroxy-5-beta-cholest-24-enoyl-CoA hydratase [Gammaproteobacteria bacterium]